MPVLEGTMLTLNVTNHNDAGMKNVLKLHLMADDWGGMQKKKRNLCDAYNPPTSPEDKQVEEDIGAATPVLSALH